MDLYHNDTNDVIASFAKQVKKNYTFNCSKLFSIVSLSDVFHVVATAFVLQSRTPNKTIQNSLYKKHEHVKTQDGGTVCFTWYPPTIMAENIPILFILDTFSGSNIFEALVCATIGKLKWHAIILHRRGVHCPLTTPAEHITGSDEDVAQVLEIVHKRHPTSPIFCMGFSAGGSILARFLGKYKPEYVYGAVTVSSGLHTGMFDGMNETIANSMLMQPRQRVVQYSIKNKLDEKTKNIYQRLLTCGGNIQKYAEIESELYEPDLDTYQDKQLVQNWTSTINIPFLAINSMDDVICTNPQFYINDIIQNNPNALYIITKKGGHCVFQSGKNLPFNLNWAEYIGILFFQFLMYKNK